MSSWTNGFWASRCSRQQGGQRKRRYVISVSACTNSEESEPSEPLANFLVTKLLSSCACRVFILVLEKWMVQWDKFHRFNPDRSLFKTLFSRETSCCQLRSIAPHTLLKMKLRRQPRCRSFWERPVLGDVSFKA